MPKIDLARGTASKKDKKGKKVEVRSIDVPEFDDCCKLDCCQGALFIKGIDDDVVYAIWFENGAIQSDTKANFLIAKAAL